MCSLIWRKPWSKKKRRGFLPLRLALLKTFDERAIAAAGVVRTATRLPEEQAFARQ
jgi:hypothetical protein